MDDPALAGTRTTLAWQRSTVLIGATAGSLSKAAVSDGQGVLGVVVVGVLLVLTAGLFLWRGRRQVRHPADDPHRRRAMLALSAVPVVAGVCSLVIVIMVG